MNQLNFLAWLKPPPQKTKAREAFSFRGHKIQILRRSYQRSLKIQVRANGELRLTCGKGVPDRALARFLTDSWPWVEKTLQKVHALRAKNPAKTFLPNEELPFLGEPRQLQFQLGEGRRFRFTIRDQQLVCFVPPERWDLGETNFTGALHLRTPVRKFYETQAREILTARVNLFAQKLQLFPRELAFRCQRTRWGSCTSTGKLSLNWRLVAAPLAVIDYVVIHELAHLKYADHSRRFWALVAEHCPDYKSEQRWLREHQYQMDFLAPESELHL